MRRKTLSIALAREPLEAIVAALQVTCQVMLFIAMVICISGCSKRYDDMPSFLPFDLGDAENGSVGRFKTSYLAEQIDTYYRGTNPGPLAVATFVNLDDLYRTSSFGRMLGEQLMSELVMRGFEVIELRHADALQFIEADGEFALSRRPGLVRGSREVGGVIVGTYVVSPQRVYLNARLVDPSSSLILSTGSVEMSKTKEISKLLRGGLPTSLERIPVRHLNDRQFPMLGRPYNSEYDREELAAPPVAAAGVVPPALATTKAHDDDDSKDDEKDLNPDDVEETPAVEGAAAKG